tara:strand:+ start:222 stop:404 length:183 start_codon:yes stop_codon:yes gene_type:complete
MKTTVAEEALRKRNKELEATNERLYKLLEKTYLLLEETRLFLDEQDKANEEIMKKIDNLK